MSQLLEERVAAAMRAATPDLRPDPRLGRRAVEQARRARTRRWIVTPIATALVTAATFALVVVVLPGAEDARLAVDPATGQLVEAPDWAGCRSSTFDDAGVVAPLPSDPVAIAVCSPRDPLIAQKVWVAGAGAAGAIAERLAGSPQGFWIDTCAFGGCETTRFALLRADGSVMQLALSKAGEGGQLVSALGQSWIVDASLANDILGLRHTSAFYVYPRPASDGYPGVPVD